MLTFTLLPDPTQKDSVLLADIYNRYRQPMFQYAMTLLRDESDAEDVVQEIFLAVVKNGVQKLRQVDREGHLWIYLAGAVRNRCCTRLAKRGCETPLDRTAEEYLEKQFSGNATEEESAYRFLVEVIRSMKPEYADALYYFLVREMSAPEIASLLGLNPATVRKRISRGRKLLKQQLGEEF